MATEILRGTLFDWTYGLFSVNGDNELLNRMNLFGSIYTIAVGLFSIVIPAPYGRHSQPRLGPTMNATLAWILQEISAFLVPLILLLQTPCTKLSSNANLIALMLFMAHYFNRSFIFPFRIAQSKPVPVISTIMAFLFCFYNGLWQGHYLANGYAIEYSVMTIIGLVLFVTGMFINIYHDGILIALRKNVSKNSKGDSKYKIPSGGLFKMISCANYFGEIIEWWGLFVITQGMPQFVFAVFSTAFLGLRAWHHHNWYKKQFSSYPKHRKAVVPFLF